MKSCYCTAILNVQRSVVNMALSVNRIEEERYLHVNRVNSEKLSDMQPRGVRK
jgi:hypothetical protein